MNGHKVEEVAAVIAYTEAHLEEKLSLDTVAGAAGYSKYHLHRMFADVAGITLHHYIRRRRMTRAAERLVFSRQPILEIALAAGYESQQAFHAVFRSLYKRTPLEYRQKGEFYPLQLEFRPDRGPSGPQWEAPAVSYAGPGDLSAWAAFADLVVGGFPCLEKSSHLEQVRRQIRRRQVLVVRDGPAIAGAAVFSRRAGRIDFLAVHPQYRRCGIARALLDVMRRDLFPGREISITTFRQGDRADTGQREEYRRLGFAGAELLTEFGYPTQRLVLPPEGGRGGRG